MSWSWSGVIIFGIGDIGIGESERMKVSFTEAIKAPTLTRQIETFGGQLLVYRALCNCAIIYFRESKETRFRVRIPMG